jgi:hypothetical protein
MKLTELHQSAAHLLHRFEDFLHHIAEEELIACKVFNMEATGENTIAFVADCNDKERQPGYQKDLSDKLRARLDLHQYPELSSIEPRVYHKNIDPR